MDLQMKQQFISMESEKLEFLQKRFLVLGQMVFHLSINVHWKQGKSSPISSMLVLGKTSTLPQVLMEGIKIKNKNCYVVSNTGSACSRNTNTR